MTSLVVLYCALLSYILWHSKQFLRFECLVVREVHLLATLLGTPHSCHQSCHNYLWHTFNKVLKYFSEVLVHIYTIASCRCCKFVSLTSVMQSSLSTTYQRCFIGFGDCGRHWSPVNLWSYSRKPVWDDVSFVAWCVMLLEVAVRRWGQCGHKEMYMANNNTWVGCDIEPFNLY